MPDTLHAEPSRRGTLLVWAESLLIVGGTAALTWCTYIVGDAYVAQRLAREALESTPHVNTSTSEALSGPTHAQHSPALGWGGQRGYRARGRRPLPPGGGPTSTRSTSTHACASFDRLSSGIPMTNSA